jgi:hypothetical protein
MSIDDLCVQLCNILGVTIPQNETVTKLSRKKHGTKSTPKKKSATPKKKSATPKYKTSMPSKKIVKEILNSPTLAKLLFTISSPPHHAAEAPHAVNGDEDDDSRPSRRRGPQTSRRGPQARTLWTLMFTVDTPFRYYILHLPNLCS